MRPKGLSDAQAITESAAGLTRTTAVANASAEIATFTSKRPRSGRVPRRSGSNRSTTNNVASTRTTTIVKLVRSIMIKTPRLFGHICRRARNRARGDCLTRWKLEEHHSMSSRRSSSNSLSWRCVLLRCSLFCQSNGLAIHGLKAAPRTHRPTAFNPPKGRERRSVEHPPACLNCLSVGSREDHDATNGVRGLQVTEVVVFGDWSGRQGFEPRYERRPSISDARKSAFVFRSTRMVSLIKWSPVGSRAAVTLNRPPEAVTPCQPRMPSRARLRWGPVQTGCGSLRKYRWRQAQIPLESGERPECLPP